MPDPIDTDISELSPHHTLGLSRNKASRGDHTHNGENSKHLFFDETTITGSRTGGAALQNLIAALGLIDGTSP